ncbi:MAG: TolC family protein [Thermodesulfobacteriota bacterium]|nr:TolC family protein [Thermodesulfobacteriota bacterium]
MSKMVIKLLLLLLFVSPGFGVAEEYEPLTMEVPQGNLTLQEAWRQALRNSPGVAEAGARIDAAQALVDQAQSAWLPTLSVYAGYRLQNSTMQPDWNPDLRISDSLKVQSTGMQANWLVFDGFSRKARIMAAKYQVEASQEGLIEARRLLVEAVSSAFFQAQLAAESMLIARSNREFNQTLEMDADKRWQVGAIPEAEKLNFSVRALQAESDFLQAAQNFSVIGTVLAELLALPDAQLPESMYPVINSGESLEQELPDYAEEIAYALENRTDIKIIKSSMLALQESVKAEKGSYLPSIVLNSGVKYEKMVDVGQVDQEEHDSYVDLNLSWDIYSGGLRSAKVRKLERELARLRHELEQKILSVQSEIGQAYERAKATTLMYERQRRALIMTARIRDHIKKSYRAGVATLTRLNEAQTDLVRVTGATVASRINFQIAMQKLHTASGRILVDIDQP